MNVRITIRISNLKYSAQSVNRSMKSKILQRMNVGTENAPTKGLLLDHFETLIAHSLPRHEEVGLALLEIYEQKLYRPGYSSFKDYLVRRWHFSRARGYQLIHFAKLMRKSTMVDTSKPENERQARTMNSDGQARQSRVQDLTGRAMNYLVKMFERIPVDQRQGFIDHLRMLLDEMAEQQEEGYGK